jgi:hypothetical protein
MDNFFHSPSSAYTITSSPFKFQGFGQIPQGARLHSYSQLPLPSVHLVPDFEREEVFLVALWAQTAKEGQVLLELGAAAELLSAHSKVGPNWKVGYWEQEVPDIGTKLQFLEAHNGQYLTTSNNSKKNTCPHILRNLNLITKMCNSPVQGCSNCWSANTWTLPAKNNVKDWVMHSTLHCSQYY